MKNIPNFYRRKKVLVTGATGFKGAWLSYWLSILGADVRATGYKSKNQKKKLFYVLRLHKKIKTYYLDIRDKRKLEQIVKSFKPSIVFHLAAQPILSETYKKPYQTFDVNIKGTLNIIDICLKYKFVKSIVSITSAHCYENLNKPKKFVESDRLGGVDPYSASKASVELIIRSYRKNFYNHKGISSVRSGNIIGGGDWSKNRLIPDSIRYLSSNSKIKIRNPNHNRPWQFILEPLRGYLILAKKQFENPNKYSTSWNFGPKSNSYKTVKEVVNMIINFWGKGSITKSKKKFKESYHLQLNCKKANKILNWKPVFNVNHSVKKTIEWYYKVLVKKVDPRKITNDQIKEYMRINKWM